MDVTYVAAPMTSEAAMPTVDTVVQKHEMSVTLVQSQVATTLRPLSIGGTSLSAVAPDYLNREELALAAA